MSAVYSSLWLCGYCISLFTEVTGLTGQVLVYHVNNNAGIKERMEFEPDSETIGVVSKTKQYIDRHFKIPIVTYGSFMATFRARQYSYGRTSFV